MSLFCLDKMQYEKKRPLTFGKMHICSTVDAMENHASKQMVACGMMNRWLRHFNFSEAPSGASLGVNRCPWGPFYRR